MRCHHGMIYHEYNIYIYIYLVSCHMPHYILYDVSCIPYDMDMTWYPRYHISYIICFRRDTDLYCVSHIYISCHMSHVTLDGMIYHEYHYDKWTWHDTPGITYHIVYFHDTDLYSVSYTTIKYYQIPKGFYPFLKFTHGMFFGE